MLDLADLLRPEFADAQPYLPDLERYRVRLDANEAPPLLSEAARERLLRAAAEVPFERYPDPTARELREAVAERLGVAAAEVLLGVGSDELITLLLTALARPRSSGSPPAVLTTTPTFVMYKLSARLRGQRVVEVPLDAGWDLSSEGLRKAVATVDPHLIFIASPNNPTGTVASPERLSALIESASRALVVLDEAYVNYADRDWLELYRRYDNVCVLRTLSKIGFASLRVGFLIGNERLVRELDKARLPYNLPGLSQKLATLVLRELWDEVRAATSAVVAERARLVAAVRALPGYEVAPAQANFLWVKTPSPAGDVFEGLKQRGVLVRSFHERGGRLLHQVRVTVGTPEENDDFVRCLSELG